MSLSSIITEGLGPWGSSSGIGPGRIVGSAGSGPVVSRDLWSIGVDYPCQARVTARGASGAEVPGEGVAATQADVSSIACGIWDFGVDVPRTPGCPPPNTIEVAAPGLVVASVISDSLVADDLWSVADRPIDSTGRNFLFILPASLLTEPHLYRAVMDLTFADGTQVRWAHEIAAVDLTQ